MGTGAANAVLCCGALAPLALFAARGRPGAGRALLGAAGLALLSWCALSLPRVGPFSGLEWNWQGKAVDLLWLCALFLVLRHWARDEAGLRWRLAPGSHGPAARVIIGWFAASAALVFGASLVSGQNLEAVTLERLLFDSTYPNLAEELLWRGALLAVLDRVFGTPWRLFGAHVGWGFVLTSLGFGLGHGLLLSDSGLAFDPAAIVLTGLSGMVLGWVRAFTGSVWPAFAAHCAPELGISAAATAVAAVRG